MAWCVSSIGPGTVWSRFRCCILSVVQLAWPCLVKGSHTEISRFILVTDHLLSESKGAWSSPWAKSPFSRSTTGTCCIHWLDCLCPRHLPWLSCTPWAWLKLKTHQASSFLSHRFLSTQRYETGVRTSTGVIFAIKKKNMDQYQNQINLIFWPVFYGTKHPAWCVLSLKGTFFLVPSWLRYLFISFVIAHALAFLQHRLHQYPNTSFLGGNLSTGLVFLSLWPT